jgi:type IV pilus assembly protein PilP
MLAFLLGSVIAGCTNSGQAPSTPTPIAAKAAQKPISQGTPTVLEEQSQTAFFYNPTGRRDPFAPIVQREEKQAKMDRPPLERYNLYDFKMTAVIWGGFGYNAMVEAPDGKGYFVRVGTVMGPNKGLVKRITEDEIVVEEKFKNFSGETERKDVVIELRKKQEERQ